MARRCLAGRSRQRDRDIQDRRRFSEATAQTMVSVISTGYHAAAWLADANHPAHTSAPGQDNAGCYLGQAHAGLVHRRRIQAVPARSC
jgi:hypothetical protein